MSKRLYFAPVVGLDWDPMPIADFRATRAGQSPARAKGTGTLRSTGHRADPRRAIPMAVNPSIPAPSRSTLDGSATAISMVKLS